MKLFTRTWVSKTAESKMIEYQTIKTLTFSDSLMWILKALIDHSHENGVQHGTQNRNPERRIQKKSFSIDTSIKGIH